MFSSRRRRAVRATAAAAKRAVLRARSKNKKKATRLHKMCLPGTTSYSIGVLGKYLDSLPSHATATDRRGMTPLHTALARLSHRNDVAQLLIARAPAACGMRDADGRTPLHLAAMNADRGVSADVLATLLKLDPASALDEDMYGETPFSLYCGALARAAEEPARREAERLSGGGWTDPYGAQESRSFSDDEDEKTAEEIVSGSLLDKSVPLVRAIAWGDPKVPRNAENTAKVWNKMLHTALYAVERATCSDDEDASATTAADGGTGATGAGFEDRARRYRFFVRAVLNRTNLRKDEEQEQQEQQPLPQPQEQQEAAGTGGEQGGVQPKPELPHPASAVDSRGNFPLHIAAAIPFLNAVPESLERLVPLAASPSSTSSEGNNKTQESEEVEGIIDALARLHPAAASIPNTAGLLPFRIAEQCNSTWTRGGIGAIANANRQVFFDLDVPDEAAPRVLSKVGRDLTVGAMFDALMARPELLLQALEPQV